MKKIILSCLLLSITLLLAGCDSSKKIEGNAILTCTASEKYSSGRSLVDTYYEDKMVTTNVFKTEDAAKEAEEDYKMVFPKASITRDGKKLVIVIMGSYTKEQLESIKAAKETENIYSCEWN